MPDSDDFSVGRTALLEITPAATVGANAGSLPGDDGVVTVYFENTLPGYPGWRWTVSIAHVEGQEPSVLETELTPGDGALLSPAWVPWVDRLADYRAAQEALGAEAPEAEDDAEDTDDDDDDDDDELDEEDFGSDVLHGGDLDGVDIDDVDDDDDEDELAAPSLGVDEAEEAEGDSHDDGPEPPSGDLRS